MISGKYYPENHANIYLSKRFCIDNRRIGQYQGDFAEKPAVNNSYKGDLALITGISADIKAKSPENPANIPYQGDLAG